MRGSKQIGPGEAGKARKIRIEVFELWPKSGPGFRQQVHRRHLPEITPLA